MTQLRKLQPAGLPPPNSTVSFWLSQPTELAHHRTTSGLPADPDVIIVGTGIAGTLTAYFLLDKSPSLKILMLEAREVCSGATGRNGGQIKTDPYIACEDHPGKSADRSDEGFKKTFGAERANEILKFEASHLDQYKALLEREKIACDFHITSAFDLCLNREMAEIGRRSYRARTTDFPDDMKAFMEVSDRDQLERLSGVKGPHWGCIYRVGSIHPYKLVNGLLRKSFEKARGGGGWLNLQTHTPVSGLERHGESMWEIRTDRGRVTAPKVVICCNGYMSNILPEFANKVIPVRGPCSSLARPPIQPANTPGLQVMRPLFTSFSLKNSVDDFDYMISRVEEPNHIIVGGGHEAFEHLPQQWYGNIDDTTLIPNTMAYFKRFMPKHFINYPETTSRVDRLWTGVMGYSSDGAPYVGPVPGRGPGLYTMGGFSGRGMVRALGSVKALTEIVLTDLQGESAHRAMVRAGLPEAFLLTTERMESDLNLVAEGVKEEDGQVYLDHVKARL